MKIGIDATGLYGDRTGVEHYIANVVNNLLCVDQENQYVVYCKDEVPVEFDPDIKNCRYIVATSGNRKLYQQVGLPLRILRDKIDIMFYPGNCMPLVSPARKIVTMHDVFSFVIPECRPKYHTSSSLLSSINYGYWKFIIWATCKNADQLIAVSRSTEQDVVKTFNVPAEKITVIGEGISSHFLQKIDPTAVTRFKDKHNLKAPYILCVGTGTYKNVQGSVNTFLDLKTRKYHDLELVITGPKYRVLDEVFQMVKESEFAEQIRFTGYFPEEELPLLYKGAEVLLFPSFYEGFGLPVLEAFACGLPVIVSNVASLPEVAGDAALYVDPNDHKDMAGKVETLLDDKSLRQDQIARGYVQAEKFTWRSTAEQILVEMAQIMGRGQL
jgi:glycosyltransferase involved in cell wall biosynthesis